MMRNLLPTLTRPVNFVIIPFSTKKNLAGPFTPGLRVSAKLFIVSHDAKLMFSGGHWDNSLRVYNLSKNKQVAHVVGHKGRVLMSNDTVPRKMWCECMKKDVIEFGLSGIDPQDWHAWRFNIKISSYQYRKSHCGDKTILRPSYLHNGISYTGKTTSLYWIRAQMFNVSWCC